MTRDAEWQTHLEAAVEALDRSPGAPDWLKLAMRDALAASAELAPSAEPKIEPPTFFYPH